MKTDKRTKNSGDDIKEYNAPEILAYKDTLSGRFEIQAIKFADEIALDTKYKSYTYSELNNIANHIAWGILKNTVDGNHGVAILYADTSSIVPAMVGVLKTGKYYVVIDSSLPHDKIRYMIENSESKTLLTDTKHLDLVTQLAPPNMVVINTDDINYSAATDNPALHISSDSRLSLVYTSGTTGMPKGIIKTHGSRLRSGSRKHIQPAARISLIYSPSFAAGGWAIFRALLNGASLYSYDIKKYGLADFSDWLRKNKITNLRFTPSLFRQFVKLLDEQSHFPDLKVIRLSTENILDKDIQMYSKYFSEHAGLRVSYACSEVGTITHLSYQVGAKLPDGRIPVGFPEANRTIEIWDENDCEVELGQVGEIIVGGKDVYPSYWKNPTATQKVFFPDPKSPGGHIYRTGDLGKILPDGQLVHMGRIDNMIKIRGFRVETSEIETELLKQDYIENAVVVGRADNSGQMRLVAYVVLSGKSKLNVSKLRKAIANNLADYMMPAYFVELDSIPLTVSSKVDIGSLPNPKYDRPDLENTYKAASNQTETILCGIWERVLGIDKVGVRDNFFDLGGDSLLAAQLFVEIEKEFGRKLPISILYKAANVRQQADILLGDFSDEDWFPIVSINIDGSKPPLFCFPGKGGNPTRFRHLSHRLGNDQPIHMLQSRGLSGKLSPFDSVEKIANEFMDAIRETQPEGPYYLIGSSFGGKVAYEVAQQLLRTSQEVALLAFVDTYGPGYPKRLPNISRTREQLFSIFQYFDKHLANLRVANWKGRGQYLVHNSKIGLQKIKTWPKILIDKIRTRRLPAELKEVEAANIRASRAYIPEPFPGRVVIFRAEQQPRGIYEDSKLGWGNVDISELEIIDIPGHHGSILFEPRVEEMAGILKGLLA